MREGEEENRVKPLCEGELMIERTQPGPELIRLDWKGSSNFRRSDEGLTLFLYDVLDQALRDTAAIEMHFEALGDLSASTMAVLIHFLQRSRSHGIRLTILYRKRLRWQRLSFEALRVFEQVDRLVQIVALAEPPLESVA